MGNTIRDFLFYFSSAELTNDPLAKAVEILGADPKYFDLRGEDCSIQKHKQVEKWLIVADGIKFSDRTC